MCVCMIASVARVISIPITRCGQASPEPELPVKVQLCANQIHALAEELLDAPARGFGGGAVRKQPRDRRPSEPQAGAAADAGDRPHVLGSPPRP